MPESVTVVERANAPHDETWGPVYPCPACQPGLTPESWRDSDAYALRPFYNFCPSCGVRLQWRRLTLPK
jgi:hypothetical protein